MINGEFLLWIVFFGASFILACDRRIKAAEGSDGLYRVVRAERQRYAVVFKFLPGIRVPGARGTNVRLGPVHVSKQMVGLDGSNDAQVFIFLEIFRRNHLVMFDTETQICLIRFLLG